MPTNPSALDVAKLIMRWANRDGEVITNLKLQKLLYYAQAWYLVNFKRPLFNEEIEAWEFGPVIRSVYSKFKKNGPLPIDYKDHGDEEEAFTANQIKYLEEFYSVFIKYSAHALVNMSHNEKPWKEAFQQGESNPISIDTMKDFYSAMLKNK